MTTLSELTAATKLKPKRGEDDDDFRKRLVEAVSDLDDKTYGKLTKPTRTWADSAIETFNETGKVPVFVDDEEGDEDEADADDETEDEEEDVGKGKNKKPTAKKKKAPAKDEEEEDGGDEEEEDDGDAKEDDDEATETDEEDEDMTHTDTDRGSSRRSVKKGSAKQSASSGKKKKVAAAGRKTDGKSGGGQTKLKQILARDPDMSIDDLEARLKKQGHEMSRMTLSTQRSGFRHTVKVLQDAGLLKKTLIG